MQVTRFLPKVGSAVQFLRYGTNLGKIRPMALHLLQTNSALDVKQSAQTMVNECQRKIETAMTQDERLEAARADRDESCQEGTLRRGSGCATTRHHSVSAARAFHTLLWPLSSLQRHSNRDVAARVLRHCADCEEGGHSQTSNQVEE